jgi:hypothetical protein
MHVVYSYSIKVVPEQSGKVEYERFLAIPSSLFRFAREQP